MEKRNIRKQFSYDPFHTLDGDTDTLYNLLNFIASKNRKIILSTNDDFYLEKMRSNLTRSNNKNKSKVYINTCKHFKLDEKLENSTIVSYKNIYNVSNFKEFVNIDIQKVEDTYSLSISNIPEELLNLNETELSKILNNILQLSISTTNDTYIGIESTFPYCNILDIISDILPKAFLKIHDKILDHIHTDIIDKVIDMDFGTLVECIDLNDDVRTILKKNIHTLHGNNYSLKLHNGKHKGNVTVDLECKSITVEKYKYRYELF